LTTKKRRLGDPEGNGRDLVFREMASPRRISKEEPPPWSNPHQKVMVFIQVAGTIALCRSRSQPGWPTAQRTDFDSNCSPPASTLADREPCHPALSMTRPLGVYT